MRLKNFLWILLLAAIWGPSFLFIKVAVQDIPPVTLVMARVALASLTLYLIVRAQGRRLPQLGRVWRHFAFMGFFAHALPFVLFSWGELHVDSAMASILNGTTPLFTVILAHFLVADDRMTPLKLAGTLLGFVGLMALVAPSLLGGVQVETLGLLGMAVAAVCYAITIIYSRQHLRGLPPLVAPTAQLMMAAIFLLPISLIVDKPYSLAMPGWPALAGLLGLSLLGTAVAFAVYYHILEKSSATELSMVTYLIPVFGIALGVIVLGEQLTWNIYLGFAFILLGVMTVNGVFRFRWLWLRQHAVARGVGD
ncbi:MAG: DMT family transporter [Anaerolineales bacterium]|nr:DMT family transporter [Anaerolineales bacterium]